MGGQKPFVLADEREWLLGRFAAKPDLTLRELLSELHGRGVAVRCYALWNIVQRAGLRFKRPCTRASLRKRRAFAAGSGPMSSAAAPDGGAGCNG